MTTPRKITSDDLGSLQTLGALALSPDGRRVAFVTNSVNREKDENRSSISLQYLDEHGYAIGQPRQLTAGLKSDSDPIWSPDSRHLLFFSNREEEKRQLWLIDTDGGEAHCLTHLLHGVSEAAWSPNGKWIAFTAPTNPSDEDDVLLGRTILDEGVQKKRERDESKRLRTITRTWYRMDGRGLIEKYNQLFVMPAPTDEEKAVPPTAIRRLTSDTVDYTQPSWTPESVEIGIVCNRNEDRDRKFAVDLWTINPETGEERCLTDGTLEITCYAWAPDAQSVVIVGEKDTITYGLHTTRLYQVTRQGNVGDAMLELTPDLDNGACPLAFSVFGIPGPYRPQWTRDGQQMYFLLTEQGCVNVYRMDMVTRKTVRLTSASLTHFLALLPDSRTLLIVQEQSDHPWELYRLALTEDGADRPERLTHFYDALLAEIAWTKTERIRYRGANGDEIDGWLTYPAGTRDGVRYPLMVRIHGGPNSSFGIGLNPYNQYFAAQGFAIFYCNPHGSTGYGHEFMSEVIGDWGGWDFQDIMLGVDECIARGIADPERLVVTGYSYGGYMSMFIIGQTERFKAAVPMAGVANLTSFVGTSDIGIWQVVHSQGYPWQPERADYYRERSPLTYAPRVTTPTLFLHPENDLRCPIEQSEQFYTTLKIIGKAPTEFIRVPGAWHGGRKPSQWLEYWEVMLAWFRKYVELRPEEYV